MAACHASLVDSHQNCSKPMERTPTGSHLAVVGRALFIIKGNGITQDILGYDLSDFSAGRLSRSQHFPVFLRCRDRLATAAAQTVGTAERSAVSIQPSAQQVGFASVAEPVCCGGSPGEGTGVRFQPLNLRLVDLL
jgi:hypothetical protein